METLNWDVYALEAKAILDITGAPNAHILGCCMGASLALAFAVRYPSACKSLILHWPVGGYHWMMKGRQFFDRLIAFVLDHGLRAVVERAHARRTRSASWTLKELLPRAELWNVFPPEQTGANTLAELLRFTRALG